MAGIGRFFIMGCVLCAAVSLHAQTNGNGHNGDPDGYEAHNIEMVPAAFVKIDNTRESHALIGTNGQKLRDVRSLVNLIRNKGSFRSVTNAIDDLGQDQSIAIQRMHREHHILRGEQENGCPQPLGDIESMNG